MAVLGPKKVRVVNSTEIPHITHISNNFFIKKQQKHLKTPILKKSPIYAIFHPRTFSYL